MTRARPPLPISHPDLVRFPRSRSSDGESRCRTVVVIRADLSGALGGVVDGTRERRTPPRPVDAAQSILRARSLGHDATRTFLPPPPRAEDRGLGGPEHGAGGTESSPLPNEEPSLKCTRMNLRLARMRADADVAREALRHRLRSRTPRATKWTSGRCQAANSVAESSFIERVRVCDSWEAWAAAMSSPRTDQVVAHPPRRRRAHCPCDLLRRRVPARVAAQLVSRCVPAPKYGRPCPRPRRGDTRAAGAARTADTDRRLASVGGDAKRGCARGTSCNEFQQVGIDVEQGQGCKGRTGNVARCGRMRWISGPRWSGGFRMYRTLGLQDVVDDECKRRARCCHSGRDAGLTKHDHLSLLQQTQSKPPSPFCFDSLRSDSPRNSQSSRVRRTYVNILRIKTRLETSEVAAARVALGLGFGLEYLSVTLWPVPRTLSQSLGKKGKFSTLKLAPRLVLVHANYQMMFLAAMGHTSARSTAYPPNQTLRETREPNPLALFDKFYSASPAMVRSRRGTLLETALNGAGASAARILPEIL
ncbi:hypothetical protein DFH09DRAFT_1086078 [Mycena vulgaris]|nr:hypothetical protein DFH09DRAFT_1086078 [Mycena vulgaris]